MAVVGKRTFIFGIVSMLVIGTLTYFGKLAEAEFVNCFYATIGLFIAKKLAELNGGDK